MIKLRKSIPLGWDNYHKILDSEFFNEQLMPAIWAGKEEGYNYKFKLVKSKKFLFFLSINKPYVEITVTNKRGIK